MSGWQDAPLLQDASQTAPRAAWESAPVIYASPTAAPSQQPQIARGFGDAFMAGLQGSATGLAFRGKLPDVVLSPDDSKWYERAAAGVAQIGAELPLGVVGAVAGGTYGAAAGTAVGGPVVGVAGGAVGAGAASFALPAAVRQAYIEAYSKGQITDTADFLNRAQIVLKQAGKEGLIGGLTAGAGKIAQIEMAAVGATAKVAGAAALTAEGGMLVVAPATLEGRLPEPQDFVDAAILLGGLKGATVTAGKLMNIYAKTGKTPIEVLADANGDPALKEAIVTPPTPRELVEAATQTDRGAVPLERWLKDANYGNGLKEAADALGIPSEPGTHKDVVIAAVKERLGITDKPAAAKETPYVDTRGQGERFHGTSRPIVNMLDGDVMYDSRNIYGQGFYTTDAVDISAGYTRKGNGGQPTLYRVVEQNNPRLYDMEAPLTPELRKAAEDNFGDLYRTEDVDGKPITNLRELYDEVRAESKAERYTRDDVQGLFDGMRAVLEDQGYNGLSHAGGLRTNNPAHAVNIYWTPEKHVRLEPADLAAYRKAEPAAPAGKPGEQLELFSDLPVQYRDQAKREHARLAVPDPSPEAAQFLEKPFADVPQLPGEPVLKTHVNYNYLNTAPEVMNALSRMSELYEAQIRTATRGEVSWEQTYAEARDLYRKTTGEDPPPTPLVNADYAKLSADLYARKQILVSGAEQLMAKQKAYAEARAQGLATDQMKLELLAQIDRVAQAQAAVRGSQAEVGRALNILKSTNRDKAYYDELTSIIDGRFGVEGKAIGDANFDTMVDMMGKLGSPDQALKFAEKAAKATTWQKIVEAWKAGLVSGPITQTANILGNATFVAVRPLVDAVAVAGGLFRSGPDRVTAVEPLARVVGNIQGTIDGARAAWAVMRTGETIGGKSEAHRKAIEGTLGEIVRLPFRLLGAGDAFFRLVNERGEAYALAVREAASEGHNPATREFRERVAELVSNPTDAMIEQIDTAGARFTFNSPLGEKGRQIQATIKKLHLEWAVPFVQTPANVAKEMLRLTPAAPIVKEWRDAIAAGGAARDKAVAEMVIGTATMTGVFALALSGQITGQGDPDPNKRRTQMASGWQPYSVKVGDTWYSYQRLQPVGTLVGMAGDVAAVWEHMTPEESDKVAKMLATAFANAITNQTFLQGVTNLVNVISDPNRYGGRFFEGLAGSAVPGILGQTARMVDPYQREIDGVLDAVKARIPGLSETLQPKRDPYGEPVPSVDRPLGVLPIATSTMSQDKVRLEAARLGVGAAKAPDYIELPAGRDPKLGRVELTPEQRDVFATEAGKLAYRILSQMVNSPTWDNLPDMAQRNAVARVFESARGMGRAAAVPPEQIRREAERIARELQIRLQPK